MLHVALYEPEIPPNTGNIARLCAATGTRLHLIGPLGFTIDDKHLKRAGLDYWPLVDVHLHASWAAFLDHFDNTPRLWLIDNPAATDYARVQYLADDVLVFGKESTGLPEQIRHAHRDRLIIIPMKTGTVRSLNLSTSVGIVLYEAYRQFGFDFS